MKMLLAAILFFSSMASALACPAGAPTGYEEMKGQKERSYQSKDSVVVVKCGVQTNAAEMAKALALLGEVREANKRVSFVELKAGAMRIYATLTDEPVQVAVVAKSPEALAKAGQRVVDYLSK